MGRALMELDLLLLAAGFGTRLRPLTQQIPKALLPVAGVPLIERHLRGFLGSACTGFDSHADGPAANGPAAGGAAQTAPPTPSLDTPAAGRAADLEPVRIGRVVVNAHHLAEQVRDYLDAHACADRIRFSYEPQILGTGGAIAHAAEHLRSDPIAIVNCDALYDVPLDAALAFHRRARVDATMILVRATRWASVLAAGGRVREILRGERHPDGWTFTGCHLLSQAVVAALPRGRFHDIIHTYTELIPQGSLGAFTDTDAGSETHPTGGVPEAGVRREAGFLDVGTPADYLLAHERLLGNRFVRDGWIDPEAVIGEGARCPRSVVLAGAAVAPGAHLEVCIVGPGVELSGRQRARLITTRGTREIEELSETEGPSGEEDAAGPPLERFVRRAMALLIGRAGPGAEGVRRESAESGAALTIRLLAGDGSRRRFHRATLAGTRAVAIENPLPPDRPRPDENEAFLAVRDYLHHRKVRVPAFYAADLAHGLLLLEDLGDRRLADLRGAAETMPAQAKSVPPEAESMPPEAEPYYMQAIDYLVQMQMPGSPDFRPETTSNPPYTADFILEQEAGYFLRELVEGVCGITPDRQAIDAECGRLAAAALRLADDRAAHRSEGLVFMHRDYQSRNLMLLGDRVAVIDFQGARLGPPEYDLAALLFDPYARLGQQVRERLIERYLRRAAEAGVPGVPGSGGSAAEWQRIFLANAANRLMQALGAFAKLGVREGRAGFAEHIRPALDLLRGVLRAWKAAPSLAALASQARNTLQSR
ncbi:MAG: phosphotransferase [Candidatus Eisenbacteria bacterium]|nr:phosphotransferase [Candidatus Eisenbacteria bacterium]